jgi:predicted alpha/beta hydrolase
LSGIELALPTGNFCSAGAAMEISSEYVQLSVNDGTTMRAWTARPKEEGPHPGLLVFQEAFGVNAHIRDVANRFAREGFLAIAPELFHRTAAGFEGRYDDFPSTVPHMKALNDSSMAADQRAAFDWLHGAVGPNLPISAIGYCMGGRAAFLGGLTLPLAGAVRPGERAAMPYAVLLGWTGQTYSARTRSSCDRRAARGGEKFRERGNFQCRPWLLLRCSGQL